MKQKIGIDSNTLTLLIDAVDPLYDPATDQAVLANEKKAILRLFLYKSVCYYVSPTVELEYKRIKDNKKYQSHVSFCNALLIDGPWHLNQSKVNQKAALFGVHHNGVKDCAILAEAEELDLDLLLTNDKDFLKRLGGISKKVSMCRPSVFWDTLGVKKGSKIEALPASSNPLLQKTWWHW